MSIRNLGGCEPHQSLGHFSASKNAQRSSIETGLVVLGDVGRGSKLDYTAHGSAVNTAARLEALNARFGTAICVGPECRALATRYGFRSLGVTEICGRGGVEAFEPLPRSATPVRS